MQLKTATARMEDGVVKIRADPAQAAIWKAIPGRRWDPFNKQWILPVAPPTLEALKTISPIQLDEQLAAMIRPKAEPKTAERADIRDDLPLKGVTPFKHQKEAYTLAMSRPATAILHEMGCGKTLTTVAVMGRRYLDGQIQRALVVAPLSVVPVWGKEIAQYADFPVTVTPLKGSSAQKAQQLQQTGNNGLSVVVINYESARLIEAELHAWKPDMIVLDESQRIKNPQAAQSKVFHRLGTKARYRMILTGTPIGNSPLDLWSQYRFLAPDIFPSSYYAFRNRYATMGGFEGRQVVAYKHMDELTQKAHSIAHRARKEDALDLPDYTDQTLYCTLEPEARRLYNKIKKDAVAEIEKDKLITAPRIITQMLRLSQLTGGFLRADDETAIRQVSQAKLNVLDEELEDILEDENRKVVIFARFLPEIDAICKLLDKRSIDYRTITGAVSVSERGEHVNAFQTDPSIRVFVAQTRTAGLGITLHAADTAIFFSLDYSYVDYQQARDRIHRAGQRRPCTAIHLVAERTIDETVFDALRKKQNIAESIVDRYKEVFS